MNFIPLFLLHWPGTQASDIKTQCLQKLDAFVSLVSSHKNLTPSHYLTLISECIRLAPFCKSNIMENLRFISKEGKESFEEAIKNMDSEQEIQEHHDCFTILLESKHASQFRKIINEASDNPRSLKVLQGIGYMYDAKILLSALFWRTGSVSARIKEKNEFDNRFSEDPDLSGVSAYPNRKDITEAQFVRGILDKLLKIFVNIPVPANHPINLCRKHKFEGEEEISRTSQAILDFNKSKPLGDHERLFCSMLNDLILRARDTKAFQIPSNFSPPASSPIIEEEDDQIGAKVKVMMEFENILHETSSEDIGVPQYLEVIEKLLLMSSSIASVAELSEFSIRLKEALQPLNLSGLEEIIKAIQTSATKTENKAPFIQLLNSFNQTIAYEVTKILMKGKPKANVLNHQFYIGLLRRLVMALEGYGLFKARNLEEAETKFTEAFTANLFQEYKDCIANSKNVQSDCHEKFLTSFMNEIDNLIGAYPFFQPYSEAFKSLSRIKNIKEFVGQKKVSLEADRNRNENALCLSLVELLDDYVELRAARLMQFEAIVAKMVMLSNLLGQAKKDLTISKYLEIIQKLGQIFKGIVSVQPIIDDCQRLKTFLLPEHVNRLGETAVNIFKGKLSQNEHYQALAKSFDVKLADEIITMINGSPVENQFKVIDQLQLLSIVQNILKVYELVKAGDLNAEKDLSEAPTKAMIDEWEGKKGDPSRKREGWAKFTEHILGSIHRNFHEFFGSSLNPIKIFMEAWKGKENEADLAERILKMGAYLKDNTATLTANETVMYQQLLTLLEDYVQHKFEKEKLSTHDASPISQTPETGTVSTVTSPSVGSGGVGASGGPSGASSTSIPPTSTGSTPTTENNASNENTPVVPILTTILLAALLA